MLLPACCFLSLCTRLFFFVLGRGLGTAWSLSVPHHCFQLYSCFCHVTEHAAHKRRLLQCFISLRNLERTSQVTGSHVLDVVQVSRPEDVDARQTSSSAGPCSASLRPKSATTCATAMTRLTRSAAVSFPLHSYSARPLSRYQRWSSLFIPDSPVLWFRQYFVNSLINGVRTVARGLTWLLLQWDRTQVWRVVSHTQHVLYALTADKPQSPENCSLSNGGCEHVCTDLLNGGFVCSCRHGFKIAAWDNKSCEGKWFVSTCPDFSRLALKQLCKKYSGYFWVICSWKETCLGCFCWQISFFLWL